MPVMFRATFEFKDVNEHGWSETFHSLKTTYTDTLAAAQRLALLRAQLLGVGAFLPFIRVSDDLVKRDSMVYFVDPPNDRQVDVNFGPSDIANTALLIRLIADPLKRRPLYMRGLPDKLCSNSGTYTNFPGWTSAYNLWKKQLLADDWAMRSKVAVSPAVLIVTVLQDPSTGIVTINTAGPHGIAANGAYTITGAHTGVSSINGTGKALSVPSASVLTINSQVRLDTYMGGAMIGPLGYELKRLLSGGIEDFTHRITGRPFDSPRGRRSGR